MPIPRNSTAQGDVILDDPTAYLNEVARRCKALAILRRFNYSRKRGHCCVTYFSNWITWLIITLSAYVTKTARRRRGSY